MKWWKLIQTILLFCLFVPGPSEAQDAQITIEGYAYGMIADIAHDCPIRANGRIEGYVGMQAVCPVWAVDADGTFTPSQIAGIPGDSSRISVRTVHVPQGEMGFVPDTLYIEVLRQGNWHIDLFANPILFIMGHRVNRVEGQQLDYPPLEDYVAERFNLCAYEGGYASATAKSESYSPIPCPDLGGVPLPTFEVEWVLPDILAWVDPASVPTTVMAQIDERPELLAVKHRTNTLHPVALTHASR